MTLSKALAFTGSGLLLLGLWHIHWYVSDARVPVLAVCWSVWLLSFHDVSRKEGKTVAEPKYKLNIRAEIRPTEYGCGAQGLQVSEEVDVSAENFLEMSKILGQFHDLAEKIRAEQKVRT
jgi:hypothetical protein